MQEPQDKFWKWFFSITAGTLVVGALAVVFFLVRPYPTYPSLPNSSGGFFAYAQVPPGTEHVASAPAISHLYSEGLPPELVDTSWKTGVLWNAPEKVFEGAYAARVGFSGGWSGVAVQGTNISTTQYKGFSLALYVESSALDALYLELYDTQGGTIGRQELGWYYPSHKIEAGVWQQLTIPLTNFMSIPPAALGGFAIISEHPGVLYIDNINFAKDAPPHMPWKPKQEDIWVEVTLRSILANATSVGLPYSMPQTSQEVQTQWNVYGEPFEITEHGIIIGSPKEGGSTQAVFLGGLTWQNYRIDAVLDWGPARTFSILARVQGEQTLVSCNFSVYGGTVQIYSAQNGKAELLSETPYLGMPSFDAWKEVPVALEVQDGRVSCFVRGERVLSATPTNMAGVGTIGFEVWDPSILRQPHRIRSFTVTPL